MAIRKLAMRLREHDWLAFVIEVVIVIVGVFIGLQVNNWNQERQDDARGDDYLRRIDADLAEESALVGRVSAFWGQVGTNADGALDNAESGALVRGSAWRTLLAYYQGSQVWPLRQPGSTFDEIRSSGEQHLIRDRDLRAAISSHYDRASGNQSLEVLAVLPAYREHVRGLVPWKVQQYIWGHCFWTDGVNQRLVDCAAPMSEPQAQAIVDQLRQRDDLVRELRFWRATLAAGQLVMGGLKEQTDVLDAKVRAGLARH
jgi:hypothetical protein